MYTNKDDKNILVMILVIFAVSIIALVAIGNIIWKIIQPGVDIAVAEISNIVRINRLDYNFEIPVRRDTPVAVVEPLEGVEKSSVELTVEQQAVADMNLNYSFFIPEKDDSFVAGSTNFFEEIYSDSELGPVRITEESNKNFVINIEELGINSPAYISPKSSMALKFGFWMHKSSYSYNQGELVFLCTRRFFDNTDPRSCYFLNLLEINDEIKLEFNGEKSTYKITKQEYLNGNYDNIYNNISADSKSLKIVTTGKVDTGRGRLIISATRI